MHTIRQQLEMLFIISLGTALGLFVLLQTNKVNTRRMFSGVLPTQIIQPTKTLASPIQTSIMDSPDGTITLTMEKQQQSGLPTKYFFYTIGLQSDQKTIFNKEVDDTENLSIPYNAWSPDNKYVFLKESTPTINNYYVFASSGNPLYPDKQYINIQELFSEQVPDFAITDVTGWADSVLVVVNTVSKKQGQKVSFWFDVSSQSFIRLSTYFD
ncbi:hypothetical protein A2334_02765 [Candidatus Roizmanbacteria bacterium RIFOXYB2_FULL_38_10]|nr:MAG: hypothetical protein A2334_02765 [Candidatus Roizmanbacteria bacterium RIFOXYB2_FULL_38_10]